MNRILSFMIINIMLCATCYAQCENGQCGQPYFGQQGIPAPQPLPQIGANYTEVINANFLKHRERLEAIEKALPALQADVTQVKSDIEQGKALIKDQLSKTGQLNQGLINASVDTAVASKVQQVDTTLTGKLDQARSDIDAKIASATSSVATKINATETKLGDVDSKLERVKDIAGGALAVSGDIKFIKYIIGLSAAGTTGISGIALAVAFYALKKRGPAIIKRVIEHHNQPVAPAYVEPININAPVNQGPFQVHPSTIPPQVVTQYYPGQPTNLTHPHMSYVPVEKNDFRVAYEKACTVAGKRYPGQSECLGYVDSIIAQELNAVRS